jgi:23S rRNA (uracil1939-C5)-methyltransferase
MDAKVQIVREALLRTAKIEDAEITVGGQVASAGTRTTVRMAVNAEGKLGFRRANSHEVIDTPTCLIAHPLLNNFIADVRVKGATEVTLRCAVATGEIGAWLHNEDGEEAPGASIKGLPKNAEVGRMAVVHEHVHDVALQVSMSAFFQASPEAAEMLVSAVNDAAGEEALTGQLGLVVDAYGGGGLFTATLVDNDVPVTIVESSPSACADARRNLHEHAVNIQQIAFEQWSPQVAGLVIADPARNGLGAAGVENLALTEASKVVLVSCDAVAGARDIRLLMNAGYTCDSITVLDLFPHTPHVEVVSAFTRT